MKKLQLSDSERKQQMRLNILRHREKLLKLLVNTSDTTIRSKIRKLYPKNEIEINVFAHVDEKPPIKAEVKQEIIDLDDIKCENANDDTVSVGFNSERNTICENEIETLVGSRKSIRLKSVGKDVYHNKWNEKFVYNMPHAVGHKKNLKHQKGNSPKKQIFVTKQYFNPVEKDSKSTDRSLQNAKERGSRKNIAKLFTNLSQMCSNFKSNKRYPSKASILEASKKECDLLNTFEKKLLIEKEEWAKANAKLMKKIRKLSTEY